MFDTIYPYLLLFIYLYIIVKASFYEIFEEEDRIEAMKERQNRLDYEKKFIKYKKMQKKNENNENIYKTKNNKRKRKW